METLLSFSDSKQLDLNMQKEFSLHSLILIESAARAAYMQILPRLKEVGRILFVAGCGNNGADAIALARIAFADGIREISIFYQEGKESEERRYEREVAERFGIPHASSFDADLIIDGLYGISLKGEVREDGASIIRRMNDSNAAIISLDVPSGLGPDTSSASIVNAEETICFAYLKKEAFTPLFRSYAGRISVVNPSFLRSAVSDSYLLETEDYKSLNLPSDSYKNRRGHVAIFGGSPEYRGAVRLSAKAAFASGAGLVTVFTHPEIIDLVSKDLPSCMVRSYYEPFDAGKYDSVLFGPGIGSGIEELLEKVLNQCGDGKKVVIDADGIKTFCNLKVKGKPDYIFTPHIGEFRSLLESYSINSAMETPNALFEAFNKLKSITASQIVLKADVVVLNELDDIFFVDGSNPSLGVAGSGDILSGMIAVFDKTSQAVLLHQKAGKEAHILYGFYPAEELLTIIGRMR